MFNPTGGGENEGRDGSDLATRVQKLEGRWQQLNSLPTNSEMFRRLNKYKQIEEGVEDADAKVSEITVTATENASVATPLCRPRQPMSELWHAIQLLNKVENNTAGITRVCPIYRLFSHCIFSLTL